MAGEKIVVGVDGSEQSKTALRWAVDEARLRGATLHVVHAWQFPSVGFTAYGGTMMPTLTMDDLEKGAEEVVRNAVAEVMGADLTPPVTTTVEMGNPAVVLIKAAEDAGLLVVGSRGHGGFTGLLLGSVSTNVLHHAVCPVVVVRQPNT